ncbi:MAG: Lrp/AsnC family transcriptional regulator [Hyphomonadaceae bacterium]|jgi:Lrp/AsnC family transcriptional regulator|nr:Lrp/AsnC family transcriptional regulator [Hyphomonadaceae bacterium]
MSGIDRIDLNLLTQLQRDGAISQRDLGDRVGLSQNACWRRLQRLNASGLIKGTSTQIHLSALGLDLTVFVMVRTRHHSKEWADRFREHVERLPEVIDFHRIGGDWDYMIKVVTKGMGGYDIFYQRLITNFDLDRVTGLFSMEALVENRAVDLTRLAAGAASGMRAYDADRPFAAKARQAAE